jgi:hypothetical protein
MILTGDFNKICSYAGTENCYGYSNLILTGCCNHIYSGPSNLIGGGTLNTSSGTFSTILNGCNNTILNATPFGQGDFNAIVNGSGHYISGVNNFIGGGTLNYIGGFGADLSNISGGSGNCIIACAATIGGGTDNYVAGLRSVIGGGYLNCADAWSSTLSGGICNTTSVSACYATVIGGLCNTVSGYGSTVLGGESNHACCQFSIAMGCGARAVLTSEVTHAPKSAAASKFQNRMISATKTTNSATTTYLATDGSSERITIPAQSAMAFTGKVTAYNTTQNSSAWWTIEGGIQRDNANNTSLIGCSSVISSGVGSSFGTHSFTFNADDTNEALNLSVTSANSDVVYWGAKIDGVWVGVNALS